MFLIRCSSRCVTNFLHKISGFFLSPDIPLKPPHGIVNSPKNATFLPANSYPGESFPHKKKTEPQDLQLCLFLYLCQDRSLSTPTMVLRIKITAIPDIIRHPRIRCLCDDLLIILTGLSHIRDLSEFRYQILGIVFIFFP